MTLEVVPAESKKTYNIVKVITEILDNNYFFEVHKNWARNIVVGFGRINGNSIGIIANQPQILGGALDLNASDKAARFIRFCDEWK